MTYMAGLNGEYAIECYPYDGFGGAFGESKDLVAGQLGEQPRLVVIF